MTGMTEQWEKLGGDNGEAPIFEFVNEGDSLEGELVLVKQGVGTNKSTLYTLKTENGPMKFWGTDVLDSRLVHAERGDIVRLFYKGKKTSEKTGRPYHDFEVFRKKKV